LLDSLQNNESESIYDSIFIQVQCCTCKMQLQLYY